MNAEAGPSRLPYEPFSSAKDTARSESGTKQVLYYVDQDGNRIDPAELDQYDIEGEGAPAGEHEEQQRISMEEDGMLVEGEAGLPKSNREEATAQRRDHQEGGRLHGKARASIQEGRDASQSPIFNSKPTLDTTASHLPDYVMRYQLRGHRKHISAVKFSPDGKWLATAGADGRILLFSLLSPLSPPSFIRSYITPEPAKAKPRPRSNLPQTGAGGIKRPTHAPVGGAGINDITFSPDSMSIASAGDDKLVRIWSLGIPTTSNPVPATNEEEDGVQPVVPTRPTPARLHPLHNASPNTTYGPSSIEADSLLLRIFPGHTSFVFCLSYSPTGNLLASGSYDETIKMWDVKKGTCLRTLPAHSDPVSALTFSGDGTVLASTGHDGLLRLWDATTGQCLKTLVDEDNPPASFCLFTPNSSYILTSALDSTLRLWDYHSASCVKTYTGHRNLKYHIGATFWLPSRHRSDVSTTDANSDVEEGEKKEDTYVISGSEDGKIWFWELQSKRKVYELQGHEEAVLSVALDPTSGMLATASLDAEHTVKIWTDRSRIAQ